MRLYLFCVLLITATLLGCTKVEPWQKGNLAKPNMGFDPDPLEAKFVRHVYRSKEAASGGYGVAVAGCGCN
jgi:hypothetical protein